MWSRIAASTAAMAAGCATSPLGEYEARAMNAGAYSVRLTTQDVDLDRHQAELAKRASTTCSGPYDLVVDEQIVSVCADACKDFMVSTIATLTCTKKAGGVVLSR